MFFINFDKNFGNLVPTDGFIIFYSTIWLPNYTKTGVGNSLYILNSAKPTISTFYWELYGTNLFFPVYFGSSKTKKRNLLIFYKIFIEWYNLQNICGLATHGRITRGESSVFREKKYRFFLKIFSINIYKNNDQLFN